MTSQNFCSNLTNSNFTIMLEISLNNTEWDYPVIAVAKSTRVHDCRKVGPIRDSNWHCQCHVHPGQTKLLGADPYQLKKIPMSEDHMWQVKSWADQESKQAWAESTAYKVNALPVQPCPKVKRFWFNGWSGCVALLWWQSYNGIDYREL